jgi:hypothetical protein
MDMAGSMDVLLDQEDESDNVNAHPIHSLVAVMCCIGATLAARGEARMGPTSSRVVSSVSRNETLCAGFTQPFIKVRKRLFLKVSSLFEAAG